jgi:ketosteroid isomerase-like protein
MGEVEHSEVPGSATRELLRRYYEGLLKRDGWEQLLSDGILLTGTVAKESRGRDAYINNNFFKLVKGLRVKETIVEGGRGFALVNYDLVSPKGKVLSCDVAEFWKVQEGKLDSIAIYFDTSAFNSFMA